MSVISSTDVRGEKCTENFWQKPERKKLLIMPRCCWEGTVKFDQREIGCWVFVWICLAQNSDWSLCIW